MVMTPTLGLVEADPPPMLWLGRSGDGGDRRAAEEEELFAACGDDGLGGDAPDPEGRRAFAWMRVQLGSLHIPEASQRGQFSPEPSLAFSL